MSTHLPAELATLYQQLENLVFDTQPTDFPFSKRLAMENNWTLSYARLVLHEYRRFILLASLNRIVVSPSDAIDQAWHLHLTYTRSYWHDLCDTILKRPLHHEPMSGFGQDRERFQEQYAATLALYEEIFQEKPATNVWPEVKTRFAKTPNFRRVDMELFQLKPHRKFGSFIVGLGLMIVAIYFINQWFGSIVAIIASMVFGVTFAAGTNGLTPLNAPERSDNSRPYNTDNMGAGACGTSGCGSGGCGGGGCGGGGCGG